MNAVEAPALAEGVRAALASMLRSGQPRLACLAGHRRHAHRGCRRRRPDSGCRRLCCTPAAPPASGCSGPTTRATCQRKVRSTNHKYVIFLRVSTCFMYVNEVMNMN